MDEVILKKCSRCRKELPLSAYFRSRNKPLGVESACKACNSSGARSLTPVEKFWDKVDKSGPVPAHVPELGQCWVWTANKIRGYGMVRFLGEMQYAHRVSWLLHTGKLPDSFCLHKCDNPSCVRPEHLFPGTPLDNMRDMYAKGRQRPPCLKGAANGNARLSESDVREIRKLHADGVPGEAIAEKFLITRAHVYEIAARRVWRSLG